MLTENIALLVVCIAASFIAAQSYRRLNPYKQLEQFCQRKSEISNTELAQYRDDDYDNMDKKLKCYIHCLMERMGYLTKNHQVNKRRVMKFEQLETTYKNIIDQCREKYDTINDPCDYGFNIMQCIRAMKNGESVFQPPKYFNWN